MTYLERPGRQPERRGRVCGVQAGWQGPADGSPAAGSFPCGRQRPRSCPLCNARSRCEGGLFTSAQSAALPDLARLRSFAGSLASAWLTARPGPAELTAVESCIRARLRLGEDLFAGQDGHDACVCGQSMAAGGTHSLICGALWHTVVARHNALTEAWLRIGARRGAAATREPHVKERPPRPRAM